MPWGSRRELCTARGQWQEAVDCSDDCGAGLLRGMGWDPEHGCHATPVLSPQTVLVQALTSGAVPRTPCAQDNPRKEYQSCPITIHFHAPTTPGPGSTFVGGFGACAPLLVQSEGEGPWGRTCFYWTSCSLFLLQSVDLQPPSVTLELSSNCAPINWGRTMRCAKSWLFSTTVGLMLAMGPGVLNSAPHSPCWYTRNLIMHASVGGWFSEMFPG